MRKVKTISICIFFILLALPLLFFNFAPNQVSEIDNRYLTENPFTNEYEGGFTEAISDYISDRVGFRTDLIELNALYNDKVFHQLEHPSYNYGEGGYVFFKDSVPIPYVDYHRDFAKFVLEVQNYCESRGIHFVFAFNPGKTGVLREHLKSGYNYNNLWVDEFFAELDAYGVNYVNNVELLTAKYAEGEAVFNKKFDAGHWNDLGAFYGVNNILGDLSAYDSKIQPNRMEEFDIMEETVTQLPVSTFPINEQIPVFKSKSEILDLSEEYKDETEMNENYTAFSYIQNSAKHDTSSVLCFQGSYMNGKGSKFMANALSEYVAIHDYQNIFNLDYYVNMYKPDIVVFEVAEYVFSDKYFSYSALTDTKYAPAPKNEELNTEILSKADFDIDISDNFAIVSKDSLPEDSEYGYLELDGEIFDFILQEDGRYSATVPISNYENSTEIKLLT